MMEPIRTPPYHNDGYTDANRPDTTTCTVHGRILRWSDSQKLWYPLSLFLPRGFPANTVAQWNSRDLLESPLASISGIFKSNAFGDPSPSSGTNSLYATIGPLVPRPMPENLAGYYELATRFARAYNPVLVDPTIIINNESDTVFLMRVYIVSSVCAVLGRSTQYPVITTSCKHVIFRHRRYFSDVAD